MENRPDLSIIAPMYNEEENVPRTIAEIRSAMDGFSGLWEFILVNDGSTDGSFERAAELVEREPNMRVVGYEKNRGRGAALRTGFAHAAGRIVATVDFDLSYSPDHILKMYDLLKSDSETDIVLASAYMPGGKVEGVSFGRLAASKIGNMMLMYAFDGGLHTTTCVVRAYRREALLALDLQSDGKEIHLEIISKAQALGFSIAEIPATLRGRKKGKSKFRLRSTSLSHLFFCFAQRPMMFFGPAAALFFLLGLGKWSFVFVFFGVHMLAFGFLGMLIVMLRRSMTRLESRTRLLGKSLGEAKEDREDR